MRTMHLWKNFEDVNFVWTLQLRQIADNQNAWLVLLIQFFENLGTLVGTAYYEAVL